MTQLSALDAAFLYAETAQTPMALGTLHVLQLPDGYAGDFVADVRTLVASRLHLAPILHHRLVQMPYDLLTPMWVEDDDVDLEHHVRHVLLQRPGGEAQLRALVGRLHAQQLDRSRPLWEIVLIEGLAVGQWAALVRVHHAGVDGQSGALLNAALMDLQPQPRKVAAPRARRSRGARATDPDGADLLGIGVRNLADQVVELVRGMPRIARALSRQAQVMGAVMPRAGGMRGKRSTGGEREGVPRTPFNVSVTNARVWARTRLALAEVRQLARTAGCSINDVLFAVTGAALRTYLLDGNELPARSLVALMPMSTRQEGDRDMSNKVSMVPVRLHTEQADPLAQLLAIAADTRSIKDTLNQDRAGIPSDLPVVGMPWLMSGVVNLVGRLNLAETLPLPGNLVISNFVASTEPLYFCGARVLSFSPALVLMHGLALGLAMQTYHASIEIGATGCRRGMREVDEIVEDIDAAFTALQAAVAAHDWSAPPVAPRVRGRRRATGGAQPPDAAAATPSDTAPGDRVRAVRARRKTPAVAKAATRAKTPVRAKTPGPAKVVSPSGRQPAPRVARRRKAQDEAPPSTGNTAPVQ